jgi:ferredoxin
MALRRKPKLIAFDLGKYVLMYIHKKAYKTRMRKYVQYVYIQYINNDMCVECVYCMYVLCTKVHNTLHNVLCIVYVRL